MQFEQFFYNDVTCSFTSPELLLNAWYFVCKDVKASWKVAAIHGFTTEDISKQLKLFFLNPTQIMEIDKSTNPKKTPIPKVIQPRLDFSPKIKLLKATFSNHLQQL